METDLVRPIMTLSQYIFYNGHFSFFCSDDSKQFSAIEQRYSYFEQNMTEYHTTAL